MNQIALEEQLARLQKESRLAGEATEAKLLELRAQIDRMRLELTALRAFLAAANPSFAEQYPQILARTIEEVNPEFE